jgi:DNA-directed RNA polymerase specialized sigma24 family protein
LSQEWSENRVFNKQPFCWASEEETMGKKISDKGEVQSRWHQFINGVEGDTALQSFFQRHRGVGEEPRTLFEAVGEDLASSREERREQAFWILVAGMPELADILHERESRRPGWRSGAGKGQQMIDRGMDIVTYLYRNLVKEHRFETDQGKDPRPYVSRTVRNWSIDAARKDSRTALSLDRPLNNEGMTLGSSLAASLPDPTSVEDEVVEKLFIAQTRYGLDAWDFINEKEKPLLRGIYEDDLPFSQIALDAGISEEAARQRKSRGLSKARKQALKRLEGALTWYFIINADWFNRRQGLPAKADILLDSWLWDSAKDLVLLNGLWDHIRWEYPDSDPPGYTPIARPGFLDILKPEEDGTGITIFWCTPFAYYDMERLIEWVRDAQLRSAHSRRRYYPNWCTFIEFQSDSTGLPGLDKVISEIRSVSPDYHIGLMSLVHPNYVPPW